MHRPLELLAPGPRLSKATEATLSRYCKSAVDTRGDKRVVRTERLSPEEFCFEAAQVRAGDAFLYIPVRCYSFRAYVMSLNQQPPRTTAQREQLSTMYVRRGTARQRIWLVLYYNRNIEAGLAVARSSRSEISETVVKFCVRWLIW